MTTVYSSPWDTGEIDSLAGTLTISWADSVGDRLGDVSCTGSASVANVALSKFGTLEAFNGFVAGLKAHNPAYVEPVGAAVSIVTGIIGEGNAKIGPLAEKVLLWKATDNSSEIVADPATGKVRATLRDSVPCGIAVTGGAGTATVEFSNLTIAAEVATALRNAADLTPWRA